MSEAALTDSTTAIGSPASISASTSGNSTNTTSPNWSWAKSEIPTVTTSVVSSIAHSWEFAYTNSEG